MNVLVKNFCYRFLFLLLKFLVIKIKIFCYLFFANRALDSVIISFNEASASSVN